MKALNKPNYAAGEVYQLCTSKIRKVKDRPRFAGIIATIILAESEYDTHGANTSLHEIPTAENVNGILTVEEMGTVYDRMVGKTTPGWPVYNALKTQTKKCPYCGTRDVKTLDHFLSQSSYPSLVVCPLNLVPSCWECNHEKLTTPVTQPEDQLIHPYYDDIEDDQWLMAVVVQSNPVSVLFTVHAPGNWKHLTKIRMENHFKLFNLDELYTSNAASAMASRRLQFKRLHERGGVAEVRGFCLETAESIRAVNLNDWEAVMYQALGDSDWFVTQGCLL